MTDANLTVGTEFARWSTQPTSRQLVKYAGAVGDYNEHHYDLPFIQSLGFRDVLVHGSLQAAWLAVTVERAIARNGWITMFDVRYLRSAFPGTYWCEGRVQSTSGNEAQVALWGEGDDGVRCAEASATICIEGS